jgi:hypothetical protein
MGSESGPSSNSGTTTATFRTLVPPEPLDDSDDDQDSDEYEGETSLHMQSIYARRLLEQAVGHTNSPGRTTEISKAIATLQQMSEEKPSPRMKKNEMFHNAGITSRTYLTQLPLPPTDAVLYVLRESKG